MKVIDARKLLQSLPDDRTISLCISYSRKEFEIISTTAMYLIATKLIHRGFRCREGKKCLFFYKSKIFIMLSAAYPGVELFKIDRRGKIHTEASPLIDLRSERFSLLELSCFNKNIDEVLDIYLK